MVSALGLVKKGPRYIIEGDLRTGATYARLGLRAASTLGGLADSFWRTYGLRPQPQAKVPAPFDARLFDQLYSLASLGRRSVCAVK